MSELLESGAGVETLTGAGADLVVADLAELLPGPVA